MDAGCKILKLPGRAVSAGFLAHLPEVGCLRLRSLTCSCAAALLRVAVNGVIDWHSLHEQMVASNELEVPFLRVQSGMPWAPHWQAPAFATTLRAAASGRRSHRDGSRPSPLLRAGVDVGRDAVRACQPVQKVIYRALLDALMGTDMRSVLALRIQTNVPFWNGDRGSLAGQLRRLPPQTALHALRFVLGAWPTSRRMHSELLPCMFCDSGEDTFAHFITCPALMIAFETAVGRSLCTADVWHFAVLTEIFFQARHGSGLALRAIARAAAHKHRPRS